MSLISIIDLTVVTNETPMRGHKNNRGKKTSTEKKANFKNQLKSKLLGRKGRGGGRVVADKHLMDSEIKNRKRQEQREAETKQVKQRTKSCDAKGETLKMDKSRMRRSRRSRRTDRWSLLSDAANWRDRASDHVEASVPTEQTE